MAVIQKQIRLAGSLGSRDEIALFDSGSTYSCIHPDLARQLGHVETTSEPLTFTTAKDGETLRAEEVVRLDFYLSGYRFSDEFMLIPDLSERVLIGAKTLQAWRMKLDFENDDIIIDPRVTKLRLM